MPRRTSKRRSLPWRRHRGAVSHLPPENLIHVNYIYGDELKNSAGQARSVRSYRCSR